MFAIDGVTIAAIVQATAALVTVGVTCVLVKVTADYVRKTSTIAEADQAQVDRMTQQVDEMRAQTELLRTDLEQTRRAADKALQVQLDNVTPVIVSLRGGVQLLNRGATTQVGTQSLDNFKSIDSIVMVGFQIKNDGPGPSILAPVSDSSGWTVTPTVELLEAGRDASWTASLTHRGSDWFVLVLRSERMTFTVGLTATSLRTGAVDTFSWSGELRFDIRDDVVIGNNTVVIGPTISSQARSYPTDTSP